MVPTVKIVHPHDDKRPLIINQSEFDPKKHTLWENRNQAAAKAQESEPTPEKTKASAGSKAKR